ncbi:MAG: class I SAM-dependent methyltransferase [Dehalococcoidia bacterium]|jgi:ubiquinone/menaquinone biosynthesis C-methylase UbiE|nr:class I SAM-dependent methyltransferase [Dehalococcoidia bacterium]
MITIEPDILGVNNGDITLDAGCGDGRHSWEVYNKTHSLVVAFDIDTVCVKKNKYMLDSLKEQRKIKGDYHVLLANVTKLPFKAGSFHKIICSEVLEHIPEDKIAVGELIRVLRKEGAIGISVPHFVAESVCWKLSKAYYGFPGGHIRKYKTRQLLDLVDTAGLSVYTVRYKHALHSFYWMLRCVFGVKKEKAKIPALYNRLLEWDLRTNHKGFRWLEGLLNHLCPKSVAIYARKKECVPSE